MSMFPNVSQIWDRAAVALATGFYVGLMPYAPGTLGTLLGVPLAWALQLLPNAARIAVTLLIIVAGVPICGRAAERLGKKDPGPVVFDEIAAYLGIFLFVPFHAVSALLAFATFRMFDITKPWPANRLEMLPGGWGIMADDLAAALYAAGCVALLLWGLNHLRFQM